MIPLSTPHVISVVTSEGVTTYHGTRESAVALLQAYSSTIEADYHPYLAQLNQGKRAFNNRKIIDLINEIATATVGQRLSLLTERTFGNQASVPDAEVQSVLCSEELQNAVFMWLFNNDESKKGLSGYADLQKLHPIKTLPVVFGPMLARMGLDADTAFYADGMDITVISHMRRLLKNSWVPTAKEHGIINRYLEFLNENVRDQKFYLTELEKA